MRLVDGNDYGSDGGDDVSAPKQPEEIPGVVVLMKIEREELLEPGDRDSEPGVLRRGREANRHG